MSMCCWVVVSGGVIVLVEIFVSFRLELVDGLWKCSCVEFVWIMLRWCSVCWFWMCFLLMNVLFVECLLLSMV